MKRYQLQVITGNHLSPMTVFAETFSTSTNSSTSSGYYAFYCDGKLVACYPIERTLIVCIEEVED